MAAEVPCCLPEIAVPLQEPVLWRRLPGNIYAHNLRRDFVLNDKVITMHISWGSVTQSIDFNARALWAWPLSTPIAAASPAFLFCTPLPTTKNPADKWLGFVACGRQFFDLMRAAPLRD